MCKSEFVSKLVCVKSGLVQNLVSAKSVVRKRVFAKNCEDEDDGRCPGR